MSNHFTYEVNERNLRVKIKDMEFPYTEEAWQHFENTTKSSQKINEGYNKTKIHFTFNRTIVLTVLFASIIVLFSIVLFNFISIKKTSEIRTKELMQNSDKNNSIEPTASPLNKTELLLDLKIENHSARRSNINPLEAAITASSITERYKIIDENRLDYKAAALGSKDSNTNKNSKKRIEQPIFTEHLPDIRPVFKTEETELEIR